MIADRQDGQPQLEGYYAVGMIRFISHSENADVSEKANSNIEYEHYPLSAVTLLPSNSVPVAAAIHEQAGTNPATLRDWTPDQFHQADLVWRCWNGVLRI